jgi:predicted secreted hydrolase
MAHLAVTDETAGTFTYFDEISRGSLGDASAAVGRLAVHLGTWSAREKDGSILLKGVKNGYGVELSALPTKPPAIHGQGGISRKGPGVGQASHYYSLTRMKTTGRICLAGKWAGVRGESWFDHEFGSASLSAGQVGWDWFSLQMDDGTEAMLYLMRSANGKPGRYSSGTLVDVSGKTTYLPADDFRVDNLAHWDSAASGANYPSKWRITIPKARWDVTVEPTVADQELRTLHSTGVTYYEGSARVSGQANGQAMSGKAYVELTGYGG